MKTLRENSNPRNSIVVLALIGYLDVMILGGAALVAHFLEGDRTVQDNIKATCSASDRASDSMAADSDCEKAIGDAPASGRIYHTPRVHFWEHFGPPDS